MLERNESIFLLITIISGVCFLSTLLWVIVEGANYTVLVNLKVLAGSTGFLTPFILLAIDHKLSKGY